MLFFPESECMYLHHVYMYAGTLCGKPVHLLFVGALCKVVLPEKVQAAREAGGLRRVSVHV